MKTYTAYGHTFTEEELRRDNPYANADGSSKEGCGIKSFAFGNARFQYKLDQAPEEERQAMIEANEHMNRKMNS